MTKRPEWLVQAEADVDAMRRCEAKRRGELKREMSLQRGTPCSTITTYMSVARNLRRVRNRDADFAQAIEATGFQMLRAAIAAHAINPEGARDVIASWARGATRAHEAVSALKSMPPCPVEGQAPRPGPTRAEVKAALRRNEILSGQNQGLKDRLMLLEELATDLRDQLLDQKGRWRGSSNLGPLAATAAIALGAALRQTQRAARRPGEAGRASNRAPLASP